MRTQITCLIPVLAMLLVASPTLLTDAQAGIIVGGGPVDTNGTDFDVSAGVIVIANQNVFVGGGNFNLAQTTFNLFDGTGGAGRIVTPFIALFTGGDTDDPDNYDIVAIGDNYTSDATIQTVTQPFRAAGGTLAIPAGSTVVGGYRQDTLGVIPFDNSGVGGTRFVAIGTISEATDFNITTNFGALARQYHFNIGLVVPEPSTGLLLSFGLFGLVMRRRRRHV